MPKQAAKSEKVPATQLLVPENAPQTLWRLMSQQRAKPGSVPASLGAPSSSIPMAWEECSDWLQALFQQLNTTLKASLAAKENDAAASDEKNAEAAPAKTDEPSANGDANAAAPSANDNEKPADDSKQSDSKASGAQVADDASTKLRLKCSLPSCEVMSTPEKPLNVCGRCNGAHYCSVDHQRADWPTHKKICRKATAEQKQLRQVRFIVTSYIDYSSLSSKVETSVLYAAVARCFAHRICVDARFVSQTTRRWRHVGWHARFFAFSIGHNRGCKNAASVDYIRDDGRVGSVERI